MAADRSQGHKPKQEETRRQNAPDAQQPEHGEHPLLNLQRQVGNRQVARMLREQRVPALQRHAAEVEELQTQRDPKLQRTTDALQLERDLPEVGLEGGPISAGLAGRIRSKRGGGAPLETAMRSRMEGAFNTSFEHVRLHTDSESASISRSLGAKAATTGSDIFFGQGASPGDTSLVAHELTHVVQQSTMSGGGSGMTVNKEGDSHEHEANAMARAVTSGAIKRKPEEEG